jgi:hypothetical protein
VRHALRLLCVAVCSHTQTPADMCCLASRLAPATSAPTYTHANSTHTHSLSLSHSLHTRQAQRCDGGPGLAARHH